MSFSSTSSSPFPDPERQFLFIGKNVTPNDIENNRVALWETTNEKGQREYHVSLLKQGADSSKFKGTWSHNIDKIHEILSSSKTTVVSEIKDREIRPILELLTKKVDYKQMLDDWVSQSPPDERDRRITAAETIIAFIEDPSNRTLNFSELGLSSLPKPLFSHSAFQTRLNILNLGNNRLTELPPEIGNLTALRSLDVHENQLEALPTEIGNLTALTKLFASGNQLTALPEEIGNLRALTTLYVHKNQLAELPPEIGNLTALTTFYVGNNQLRQLPSEIGNLTALTKLEVSGNELTALPPQIGNLTALTFLNASSNQLRELPPEIGNLTALDFLSVSNNQLTELSPEIGSLTALTFLNVSGNLLTELPPQIGNLTALTDFYVSNNQLAELPERIGDLTALRGLDLSGLLTLSSLPNTILHLSNECNVYIENTGLSEAVRERLRAATSAEGYQGPQFLIDMAHQNPQEEARSAEDSLKHICLVIEEEDVDQTNLLAKLYELPPQVQEEDIENVLQHRKDLLTDWLRRLTWVADARPDSDHPANSNAKIFFSAIFSNLAEAANDSVFRETFWANLEEASTSCGDRVALSVLNMGVARLRQQLSLDEPAEVANFLLKAWALDWLEEIARAKIETLPLVDEIEVYLGYPIMLKDRLNLPLDIQKMLYFRCSGLADADLADAEIQVKQGWANHEQMANYLIKQHEWKK